MGKPTSAPQSNFVALPLTHEGLATLYAALHDCHGNFPLCSVRILAERIFSILTNRLLLTFLNYSKPLREFCGFTKVPDPSKITRFKQDFGGDLKPVFDKLVDLTEPICQAIDSAKADMTIFDSSGIEAFVTENNPKYANRIIRQLNQSFLMPDLLTIIPQNEAHRNESRCWGA